MLTSWQMAVRKRPARLIDLASSFEAAWVGLRGAEAMERDLRGGGEDLCPDRDHIRGVRRGPPGRGGTAGEPFA